MKVIVSILNWFLRKSNYHVVQRYFLPSDFRFEGCIMNYPSEKEGKNKCI